MYGKSNTEIYITIGEIDSRREFAVWLGDVCISFKSHSVW